MRRRARLRRASPPYASVSVHGRPPIAPPRCSAWRDAAPGRRAVLGRGRALPPHLYDAPAVFRRDPAAGAGAVARRDELEPALARARPRVPRSGRVPVLAAT